MSAIRWRDVPAPLSCRACGFDGEGTSVLELAVPGTQHTVDARRCPDCGSLDLMDEVLPMTVDDSGVDTYLEWSAGIAEIVRSVDASLPRNVSRVLDVGCGFGLSMDYLRWRHGVSSVGVEPSHAGVRGRRELGLDIRSELLTEQSDLGHDFDLVFSSEVIEHVTDPVELLTQMRIRLVPGGVIALTTPDASAVTPDRDPAQAISVLGPGGHVFAATERGLSRLLDRAGLPFHRIVARDAGLHAVASPEDVPLPDLAAETDPRTLDEYTRDLAGRARSGGSLAVGAWTRALRGVVDLGELDTARELVPRLRKAFRARHQVDPLSARSVQRFLRRRPARAGALGEACYALGMLALFEDAPAKAVALFEHAIAALTASRRALGVAMDAGGADLVRQSEYHRLLALVRIDPVRAGAEVLERLGEPSGAAVRHRARLFVELVARGALDQASALVPHIEAAIEPLLSSAEREDVLTGRDALFSSGTLAAQRGEPDIAVAALAQCVRVCSEAPADDHARSLEAAAREALANVSSAPPITDPSYEIDLFWSDEAGAFIDGWLHVQGDPGDELRLWHRGTMIPVARHIREDLQKHWPEAAEVTAAGFRVYIPGRPDAALEFRLRLGGTERSVRIPLPARRRSGTAALQADDEAQERIAELVRSGPSGPALAIGARTSDPDAPVLAEQLLAGREITGMDVHPGHRVDLIGDVHRLSTIVEPGSFPVIYSASLLEHVASPWVAAREIARALPIGGLAVSIVPWTWPTHSEPNDFWRFSDRGLQRLFGTELGFEILDSGMIRGAVIMPTPDWRELNLDLATHTTPTTAWLVARKVDDRAADVEWPYDPDAGLRLARQYPIEGLGRPVRNSV